MTDTTLIDKLKEFMESEGRSCSFDLELITPLMVHGSRFRVMTDTTMIDRLKLFVESEMRSCSMED